MVDTVRRSGEWWRVKTSIFGLYIIIIIVNNNKLMLMRNVTGLLYYS